MSGIEYTIEEVAKMLNMSEQVLRRYARNAQRGNAGRKLYARKEGNEWIIDEDTLARFHREKRRSVLSSVDVEGIKAANAAGVSVTDIAKTYHVHKSYVSMILSGKRNPVTEG